MLNILLALFRYADAVRPSNSRAIFSISLNLSSAAFEISPLDINIKIAEYGTNSSGPVEMLFQEVHIPVNGEKLPLEVRHYGALDGKYLLYDDDSESIDYENGYYSRTELSAAKVRTGFVGKDKRMSGKIFNYTDIVWKFITR